MMYFAVCETGTGKVTRTGVTSSDNADEQALDGEFVVVTDGSISDDTHYYREGEGWKTYPERPENIRSEFDFASQVWVVLPEIQKSQSEVNAISRQYLSDTDWYVVRMMETGEPIPNDILQLRAEARTAIIE
jgi:hypothetical protein